MLNKYLLAYFTHIADSAPFTVELDQDMPLNKYFNKHYTDEDNTLHVYAKNPYSGEVEEFITMHKTIINDELLYIAKAHFTVGTGMFKCSMNIINIEAWDQFANSLARVFEIYPKFKQLVYATEIRLFSYML